MEDHPIAEHLAEAAKHINSAIGKLYLSYTGDVTEMPVLHSNLVSTLKKTVDECNRGSNITKDFNPETVAKGE